MRVLLPIETFGCSASRRRATSRVHLPAPQRAAPLMSARCARSPARINEPGMTAPTGIRASDRTDRFGLCHRHPPPGAFAVALMGLEINLAKRGISRSPVRRQPFGLDRAFVAMIRATPAIPAITATRKGPAEETGRRDRDAMRRANPCSVLSGPNTLFARMHARACIAGVFANEGYGQGWNSMASSTRLLEISWPISSSRTRKT
jgi:hypothetical protein